VSPDLTAEYWEYVEADPAPRIGLDRAAVEGFNTFLEPRLRRILDANDLRDRSDILLAIDLSAGLRAYSTPLPSGYLIAHSVRFAMAVSTVCAAIAAAVPAESGGSILPPLIDADRAVEIIRDALDSARSGREVPLVRLPEGARQGFAANITEYVLLYVTCHELAHVVLGHFEQDAADPARHISMAGWAREMTADQHGLVLFRRVHPFPPQAAPGYIGPAIFFEMTEWIHGLRLAETVSGVPVAEVVQRFAEHPPASARLSALIRTNHPEPIGADLPDIEHLSQLMAAARGSAAGDPPPGSLSTLESAAAACRGAELDRLLNTTGADATGLTTVEVGPLLDAVRVDRRWAEGALATVALAVRRLGRAQGAPARHHLGLLYNLYTATYPAAGAPGFAAALRAVITDLDLIAVEQAALSWGQLTERDREPGDPAGWHRPDRAAPGLEESGS
jgi:hypothetical protein